MDLLGRVIDGRGRPIALDPKDVDRVERIQRWADALQAYPTLEPAPVG